MEPWHDTTTLEYMYHDKSMEQSEIADELGCSTNTIYRWMDRLGVSTRDAPNRLDGDVNDEQKLRELYCNQELSIRDVAKRLRCSPDVVRDRLDEFDIETRSRSESAKLRYGEGNYRDPNWLRDRYWSDMMSTTEIANMCDVSQSTICEYMDMFDIKMRDRSESKVNYYIKKSTVPIGISGGYRYWMHCFRQDRETVAIHRLLAVAEYGFDEVKDQEVHHVNRIPWDNRPENIELLSEEEHGRLHSNQYHG